MQDDKQDFNTIPHTDIECRIFAMKMVVNNFDAFYKTHDGVMDATRDVYKFITNNGKLIDGHEA